MIYLSCPYSSEDPAVRQFRFEAACKATAEMLRSGLIVICPVVLAHPLTNYGLPGDWQFWQNYDRAYLEACSALAVLALDGWQESEGVANEIKMANELEIPWWCIEPASVGLPDSPQLGAPATSVTEKENLCGD